MKFSEMEYKRPDLEEVQTRFDKLLSQFENAASFDSQSSIMNEINDLRIEFQTMWILASIKYSIDTLNKFNQDEQNFFDLNGPIYEGLNVKYYQSLVNSKYRPDLEKKWGKQLFAVAESSLKAYKPEILEDLKLENKLRTDYTKLIASAKIMYNGEERNLSGLNPFLESPKRETRRTSSEAKWKFFSDNAGEFDRLYDELVKLRDKMARKIGYKNFVEMGYARMERTDYNAEMVAGFRKQVKDFIVPITVNLKKKQRELLELDSFKYYDQAIDYKTGNAKPHGRTDWITSCARKMYEELSPETGEFFDHMVANEMMDLVTKKGKDAGGFCAFIDKYRSPFIFANFNGTMGDVEVLTHEAGHAFQAFSSRNFDVPEYFSPTAEACEIHSMSMEFLTWPWMSCFFREDNEKFKYSHLKNTLIFIPYGVAVDEFQHFVYENPDVTPEVRNKKWREIEEKYLPYLDYDNNEFLVNGGRWQQQRHIYMSPFYYIDYCLAQICAFQFWKRYNLESKETALKDYMRLCKAGGSMSFLELVKLANLISPFDKNCIESFVGDVVKWLDSVDTAKLN